MFCCKAHERKYMERHRRRLLRAMKPFTPSDATPLQFYNCVKEMCIEHKCDVDEGLIKALHVWPRVSSGLKEIFKSEYLAEQPIPDPESSSEYSS